MNESRKRNVELKKLDTRVQMMVCFFESSPEKDMFIDFREKGRGRERGGGRGEREREKHLRERETLASRTLPDPGSNLQPRYVP